MESRAPVGAATDVLEAVEHEARELSLRVLDRGFVVAIASGLLLGLMIGASALVYSGIYPLLIGFNAIPKVALVPILVIWFGVGFWPGVITASIP